MKGKLRPEAKNFIACCDELYFVVYLSASLLRIKRPIGESAKLRALRAKNVPTCLACSRAHVPMC